MISIKPATKLDAELIAYLSHRTFYDTFIERNTKEDMDLFLKEQFTLEALVKEVGENDGYFFIAYFNGILAGYARLCETVDSNTFDGRPALEISRLYATKQMIGKGIGKALMEHTIAFAKQLNKQMIWLGVWEKNIRAILFYQRFGFVKFGEHPFLLGTDLQLDWEMKLHL